MAQKIDNLSIVPLILFILLCFTGLQSMDTLDKKENYSIRSISILSSPFIVTSRVKYGKSFHTKYSIRSTVNTSDCYVEFNTTRIKSKAEKFIKDYSAIDKKYYVWYSKWNTKRCYVEEIPKDLN